MQQTPQHLSFGGELQLESSQKLSVAESLAKSKAAIENAKQRR